MTVHSPFSKSRYEHDGRHMYYIQKKNLEALEGDVPIIITGSRGTGKTTLLKSINWREQRDNNFLKSALKQNLHRDDYIGLYIKLPELKISAFSFWEENECNIYPLIFSLYIELVWLQEAINSILTMSEDDVFRYSANEEINCVKKIVRANQQIFSSKTGKSINTLLELSEKIVSVRKNIENSCLYKADINDLYKSLGSIDQISGLSNAMALEFVELISGGGEFKKFKICMDECECLSNKQLLVIQTMLRLTKFPVFYVFSFISPLIDVKDTLIPNITNQKADVQNISLDDMDKKDFEEFANGVASVRISAEIGLEKYQFKLADILGELSINAMLDLILTKSVSPQAKALLKKSQELSRSGYFGDLYDNESPIYQTYLIDKLHLDVPDPSGENWERRHYDSKELRKKMVVAYLSICSNLNTKPLYASSAMVYGISDKSIRDFLWQLDEIFKLSNKNLSDFIGSKIEIETQSKAIKLSSEKKLMSLPKSSITSPDNVGKLIVGLAHLTEIIQSQSSDNSHLRSTERGLFSLGYSVNDSELIKFIQDASEAGFLKITSNKENIIKFRVHNSLSPAFSFSYRGSYYETLIKSSHLMQFVNCKVNENISKIAYSIAETIYKISSKQDQLF